MPSARRDGGSPPPSSPPLLRSRPERALAWIVTGPLGHLYGLLADLTVALARHGLARARARRSEIGERPDPPSGGSV